MIVEGLAGPGPGEGLRMDADVLVAGAGPVGPTGAAGRS